MPEPPYAEIARLLGRGEVVPFLGAGVNCGVRPDGMKWDAKSGAFLPTGAELARFLADQGNFPSQDDHDLTDLPKVASYFVQASARRWLREHLHEIFDKDFQPCETHKYLTEVLAPLLIVTTNYDALTEEAFRRAGRPFDLVVHPTDRKDVEASVLWWKHGESESVAVEPAKLLIDLKTTTVIYKMHGTIDRAEARRDSYVITEEDYVDFLSRMTSQGAVPSQFLRHFRTRHFLFLGYGLRDWNMRVVLKNLKSPVQFSGGSTGGNSEEDKEELRSWAIQQGPSSFETELWNARKVKIYDMGIDQFVQRLRGKVS